MNAKAAAGITIAANFVIAASRRILCMSITHIYDSGVRPEFELFDTGDISLLRDLLASGTFRAPALCNLVLGVKYGFPASSDAMFLARSMLPQDAPWTTFGIGRQAFPMLLQSYLLGGHVRIGMEDTIRLSRTELVQSNAQLVEKAKWYIESLGGAVASADAARQQLCLLN